MIGSRRFAGREEHERRRRSPCTCTGVWRARRDRWVARVWSRLRLTRSDLSATWANTFLSCSAKWWFKYGAGLPDPKDASLVLGLAVHKTIERWFSLTLEGAAPAQVRDGDFSSTWIVCPAASRASR
ncbi:MAG: PD-(D/E)XK nuclease family protein [Bryobacteraceae bacterium]